VTGPISYIIKLSDGTILHCHVDHVKARESDEENQDIDSNNSNLDYIDGSTNELITTACI